MRYLQDFFTTSVTRTNKTEYWHAVSIHYHANHEESAGLPEFATTLALWRLQNSHWSGKYSEIIFGVHRLTNEEKPIISLLIYPKIGLTTQVNADFNRQELNYKGLDKSRYRQVLTKLARVGHPSSLSELRAILGLLNADSPFTRAQNRDIEAILSGHITSNMLQTPVSTRRLAYNRRHSINLPLHLACMNGDLRLVKTLLKKSPTLLESQDNNGYTPLLLALYHGQEAVVGYLLELGASVKPVKHPTLENHMLIPVDFADSWRMLEMLFYHGADVADADLQFESAWEVSDIEKMKLILTHLNREHSHKRGFNPWDIALKRTLKNSTTMMSIFLQYWQHAVPNGPYDRWIPDEFARLFQWHNEHIHEINLKAHTKLKLTINPSIPNAVCTEIQITPFNTLQSYLMESAFVNKALRRLIRTFPFKVNSLNSVLFPGNLPEHRKSYVDCWMQHGMLVAFFAFDIEIVTDSTHGPLLLLHAKLSCTRPEFHCDFLDLNHQRLACALQKLYPKHKVCIFFKATPPGHGMRFIPTHTSFYPKHYLPASLVKAIWKGQPLSALDDLAPSVHPHHLSSAIALQLHQQVTEHPITTPLPITYVLDESNFQLALARLKRHGVTFRDHQAFTLALTRLMHYKDATVPLMAKL